MNQSTTLRDSNSVHLVQLVCSVTIVKNFKSAGSDPAFMSGLGCGRKFLTWSDQIVKTGAQHPSPHLLWTIIAYWLYESLHHQYLVSHGLTCHVLCTRVHEYRFRLELIIEKVYEILAWWSRKRQCNVNYIICPSFHFVGCQVHYEVLTPCHDFS